ncbi:MAG: hypothetical protein AABY26_01455, partial [Nanoarchaeota archaeon]
GVSFKLLVLGLNMKICFIADANSMHARQWIEYFCNTNYDTINSQVNRILGLGDYTITIRKNS